jgi:hypothetical protein
MKCPRCQHENPLQAKFCRECGARVALTCTKCRSELPAGAKFCLECGETVASQGARGWVRGGVSERHRRRHRAGGSGRHIRGVPPSWDGGQEGGGHGPWAHLVPEVHRTPRRADLGQEPGWARAQCSRSRSRCTTSRATEKALSNPAVSFSLTWLSAPGGSNRRWRPCPPTVLSVSTTQPLAKIRGFLHRHARHGLRRSYGRGWGSP